MSVQRRGNFYTYILQNLLFVLGLTLSFSAFAKSSNLKDATQSEILRVTSELESHFRVLSDSLHKREKYNINKDLEAVRALSQYAILESAKTLWHRYRYDVINFDLSAAATELRQLILNSMFDMVGTEDELFIEIAKDTEKVEEALGAHQVNHEHLIVLAKEMRALVEKIKTKPGGPKLSSIEELIEGLYKNRNATNKHLSQFSRVLRERIKGQDEVIEALEFQEWESQFFARKDPRPSVIYLMGAPGTGKDTAAMAFTDALNGYEGAYKKHMYRLPTARTQPELWQILGSSTGYLGSGQFPPFLKFLIEHSGGKYLLKEEKNGSEKEISIIQNPDWKGESLPGFAAPETAVVYVDEFHNWSRELKDVLIKKALEMGIFNVNNPKGGLPAIEVPVRFVFASNEGASLTSSREANGQRFGKPLTYEERYKKWLEVRNDKSRLKAEILATNGAARTGTGREVTTGISEELLNRIRDRFLLLMAPISPKVLQEIAALQLQSLSRDAGITTALNPGLKFKWDDALPELIQSYDYNSEDESRPIEGKIQAMVNEPLIRLIRKNKIPLEQEPLDIHLKIVKNDDGSLSLQVEAIRPDGTSLGVFLEEIPFTEKDKEKPVISDAIIDELAALGDKIRRRVFGVDAIADRVAERVLSLANQTVSSKTTPRNATTLVLMGLSSTGKTELAKAIAEALTGDERNALVIDFSQAQALHDFKTRILGTRDAAGNPIPSDFMMQYDRSNGNVVVVFDELSNVQDPALLRSLFDFFREPVVTTFSDGKERVMSQVKVIVTGNSGIEEFKSVPRWVPMEQQMVAWAAIAKAISEDEESQRSILERSFPEPLLNRWGRKNIFFVPPHSYKSLKQLSILKMQKMLKSLEPESGRRGWYVGFANKSDFESFIRKMIEVAFTLREQGSSIDNYIKDDIYTVLEAKLLKEKVPSGSKILIKKITDQYVFLDQNKKIIGTLEMKRKLKYGEDENDLPHEPLPSAVQQALTAYHEVGHALAYKVLLSGLIQPKLISIEPGVAKRGDQWIAYAGVAKSEILQRANITREYIVREIAVLAAGETAERLVTLAEVHNAGKSDDMQRATTLAQMAVLTYGLSETWGTEAVPTGSSIQTAIDGFSPEKKALFEKEVTKLLNEGRALARHILEKNLETVLIPMGKELAEKATLKKEEMEPYFAAIRMYEKNPSWLEKAGSWVRRRLDKKEVSPHHLRDGVFRSPDYMPNKIADIAKKMEDRKHAQYDEVELPQDLPLFSEAEFLPSELNGSTCQQILQ